MTSIATLTELSIGKESAIFGGQHRIQDVYTSKTSTLDVMLSQPLTSVRYLLNI